MDRLLPLLDRFRIRTSVYHVGALCGTTVFRQQAGRGFLHVLREGRLEVVHRDTAGALQQVTVETPSVVFYPRPIEHVFRTEAHGADFTCAALDIEGGPTHPLVLALPPVLVIPLEDLPSLAPVLDLLFAEVGAVNCGSRLIADRLFEVVLVRLLRWILDHAEQLGVTAGVYSGLADDDLAPVLVAVHEQPGDRWTVATMAARAHMSRSAFASRFQEVMGCAPGEYLTRWRLTVAQKRFLEGAQVGEVAAELGYSGAASLSRVFSQHFGQSPRTWAAATSA